jgi:hypothetical protein
MPRSRPIPCSPALPQPYRATPAVVGEFLDSWFGGELPQLPPAEHAAFRQRLVALGIAGGAVYDALIAWAARYVGASLATFEMGIQDL